MDEVLSFGESVRRFRLAKQLTLREFCDRFGYDPGNHSRLERGVLPPLQDLKKLTKLAKDLGLQPGSKEWQDLQDRAMVENGLLPQVARDNKELLRRLPVLFRTIGSKPLPPEKLDEIIDLIAKS